MDENENEKFDVSKIKAMTVEKLKQELKKRNLSVKGKKAELRKRLNTVTAHRDIIETFDAVPNQLAKQTVCDIDKDDFDLFIQDFVGFKEHVIKNITNINERMENDFKSNSISILQKENDFLKQELKNKQLIIDMLCEDLKKDKKDKERNIIDFTNTWHSPRKHISTNTTKQNSTHHPIINKNKYDVLEIERTNEELPAKNIKETAISPQKNSSMKRNGFPVDEYPEKNLNAFSRNNKKHTQPGNSCYADIVSKGKKITVFGDSIIKRINGRELGKHTHCGRTYIKSFPGAKSKALNHYVIPTLIDEVPDVVIIHAGTNDINTPLGAQNIAHEIIKIGKTCQQIGGVNDVFISSITCRRNNEETKKVKEVNDFLRELCVGENFYFINNDFIKMEHLWKDGLHLLDEGTNILANNFINSLNENIL